MKQFEVKIGDKIEFTFIDRLTGIDYGIMTGIVEDIEYPYEHEWDDITVICNQFPQGVEISNECVRRIINNESTKS